MSKITPLKFYIENNPIIEQTGVQRLELAKRMYSLPNLHPSFRIDIRNLSYDNGVRFLAEGALASNNYSQPQLGNNVFLVSSGQFGQSVVNSMKRFQDIVGQPVQNWGMFLVGTYSNDSALRITNHVGDLEIYNRANLASGNVSFNATRSIISFPSGQLDSIIGTIWRPNTSYNLGDVVCVSSGYLNPPATRYYAIATGSSPISSSSEPTWLNGNTVDGGVTWAPKTANEGILIKNTGNIENQGEFYFTRRLSPTDITFYKLPSLNYNSTGIVNQNNVYSEFINYGYFRYGPGISRANGTSSGNLSVLRSFHESAKFQVANAVATGGLNSQTSLRPVFVYENNESGSDIVGYIHSFYDYWINHPSADTFVFDGVYTLKQIEDKILASLGLESLPGVDPDESKLRWPENVGNVAKFYPLSRALRFAEAAMLHQAKQVWGDDVFTGNWGITPLSGDENTPFDIRPFSSSYFGAKFGKDDYQYFDSMNTGILLNYAPVAEEPFTFPPSIYWRNIPNWITIANSMGINTNVSDLILQHWILVEALLKQVGNDFKRAYPNKFLTTSISINGILSYPHSNINELYPYIDSFVNSLYIATILDLINAPVYLFAPVFNFNSSDDATYEKGILLVERLITSYNQKINNYNNTLTNMYKLTTIAKFGGSFYKF